jgi:hypothetical protein
MATLAQRVIDLAAAIRDKINLMVPRLLPSGGSTGQLLSKSSGTNYAVGWADPPSGGGWTQIATLATTSGATASFNSIPQTYNDLYVMIDRVSHANGSNTSFGVHVSGDGTTYDANTNWITAAAANTCSWCGGLFIPGYRGNSAPLFASLSDMTGLSAPAAKNPAGPVASSAMVTSTGIRGLRFYFGAGNFDAGTITLFGR